MANEVYANMMEVSCKSGSGKTICAMPDVCFTPPENPATPPGVPIPYPNTGKASDATDGSKKVKISGKEVMLKNKSSFKKSSGNEAGSAAKKGVVTSKNTGKVFFNAWSMDVKFEGENVVRHLDLTTNNHASVPGNSPPMPHIDGMSPGAGGSEAEACPLCPAAGSPVNPIQGAKVLAGEEDLDFIMEGPLPLQWQRSYRSTNQRIGWFGKGWLSPLEVSLEGIPDVTGQYVDHIDYIDTFGRRISFPHLAAGGDYYLVQEQLTLSRTDQEQYRLQSVDGVTYWFMVCADSTYRLSAITDRNDNTIRLEYVDHAQGTSTIVVYTSGKQQIELTLQASRLIQINQQVVTSSGIQQVLLMSYQYSNQGDLHKVINRAGECMRVFDYNSDRLMRRQVYAGKFEATYIYVGEGESLRVIKHEDNVGRSWTFDYQEHYTAVTDQDGRVSLYHFDDKKRWIGFTDAAGQVTHFGLDVNGNLRAVVDPAENVTESIFDERGNTVEYHDASGAVAKIDWHPTMVLPIAVTDPLNRTTQYEYDDRGNLITEINPAGASTTYEYDEKGLVVSVTDANEGVTHLEYNEQAQLTKYTDCSGNVTFFKYDKNGWFVSATDALDQTMSYSYDAAGRVIKLTYEDGSFDVFEKDLAGLILSQTNAQNSTTHFTYTPDGLLSEYTNALGHTLKYQYDNARKLVELVNENGAEYKFVRDSLDRLVEETRFDGTQTHYRYDESDFLIETIEALGTSEEIITKYSRDSLGRLLERVRAGSRSMFQYDEAGQIVEANTIDPFTKVQIAYDAAGRRVEESQVSSDHSYVLKYSYDPLGNCLSTILPNGQKLSSLYYGSGHAHQLLVNDQPISDIERDVLHREIARTQGSLKTSTFYDPVGRMQQRYSNIDAGSRGSLKSMGDGRFLDRSFDYDRTGRLVSVLDRSRKLVYQYDSIDRLIEFNDERFIFDPAHNLVSIDSKDGINAAVIDNRLSALGDIQYLYDFHGRVVEKSISGHSIIYFKWNDDHRLVESTINDAKGSRTTRYDYDPFGRRIAKRNEQGTIWFVWDKDRLLQEHHNSCVYTFIYEPDVFGFVPYAQMYDNLDFNTSQIFYYHCDQIGMPRELTDQQGNIFWEGTYCGWGRLIENTNRSEFVETLESPTQPLRFQGEYSDDETGLHYSLMRYYDPDTARFVTRDPIGLMGGINDYQYSPNPTGWIDPWGLTGTYIFTNGTTHYIGKGPKKRFQASQKERLAACPATAAAHEDFGDDEMGFMVEHLLMEDYGARDSSSFANSDRVSSPGKKKLEKASPGRKGAARKKANALKAKFKAAGGC